MEPLPKKSSPSAPIAPYLLLALGLVFLGGCATGGKAKIEPPAKAAVQAPHSAPQPAGPTVEHFKDGRQGFVINEHAKVDAEVRGDFEQGSAMIREGKFEKAVELLEKVVARSPGLTAPHINAAIAYNHLKKPEQAEAHLKAALELVPGHPVASNEYGLMLRKAGRFADSRVVFEKSLAAFPEYHPINRNLAILCDLYLKDLTCAQEQYELYSKAMPADKQVKVWLADLSTRTGHVAMQTGGR